MNIINNDSIQRIMNYTDRNSVKGRLYKALGKEVVPQLSLFGQKPPLLEEVEKLEIDSLTPPGSSHQALRTAKEGGGGVEEDKNLFCA